MRNRVLLIPGMLVILTMLSFTDRTPLEIIIDGIYGICDCEDTKSMKFTITFNDDNTFHYIKIDDPTNVIDVNGNWEMKGNSIILKDYDTTITIHEKWTFDKNEPCLRSRKGFEWMRLCQLNPCK